MCKYCEKPNKEISTLFIGVSAFVGAGRLLLRLYDEELNRTFVAGQRINYCPMCGRKFAEDK